MIAQSQEVSQESLPEPAERHDDLPGLAMVVSLLSATLSQAAAQGKVAVGLVGGSSDLKELVRWYLDGQDVDHSPDLLKGWRNSVCGKTLLDVLSGRRALRIVDPQAEVPVALDPVPEG